jgi:hypothetical protein
MNASNVKLHRIKALKNERQFIFERGYNPSGY